LRRARPRRKWKSGSARRWLAGDTLINFDNCEQPLGGEQLCQSLTQTLLKLRILGKSEQPTVVCNAVFVATGNNLVVIGDMARRSIRCTLDPKMERPETREFKARRPGEARTRQSAALCRRSVDRPAGLFHRRAAATVEAARLV
jgi:hypothetical protein